MKPFEKIEWHAGEPPAVLQGAPVPLKIGIHEDLVKLGRSPATEVRKALRHYCVLKPYIAALLVDQAMRYDAAGEPVEPVSEGAQIAAAALLRYRLDAPKKPASACDEPAGVLAPKPENVERVVDEQAPAAERGEAEIGNFKKAVTGDLIDGREVRRRRVQFRPVAQHVFAANRLSTFRSGMDEGVKRRLLIIEFLRKIPKDEQIAELGARIAAEEPDALLDFAVSDACDLTRIGCFVAPDSSDRALGEWAETANPVAEFVKSYFVRTESHVRLDDAYKAFRTWAVEEAGIAEKDIPHRGEFGDRVCEQLGRPRTYVTGGFKGWRGVMLTWRIGRKPLKKKD